MPHTEYTGSHRAGIRAEKTADLVKDAVADGSTIWTLNHGQYRDQCATSETSGTSWQWPFIVIAVKELRAGTNLGEMSGKMRLLSPEIYSASLWLH